MKTLTARDLSQIEVALRLRAESSEDNGETRAAKRWRSTHAKVVALIESKSADDGVPCPSCGDCSEPIQDRPLISKGLLDCSQCRK